MVGPEDGHSPHVPAGAFSDAADAETAVGADAIPPSGQSTTSPVVVGPEDGNSPHVPAGAFSDAADAETAVGADAIPPSGQAASTEGGAEGGIAPELWEEASSSPASTTETESTPAVGPRAKASFSSSSGPTGSGASR